MKTAEIISDEKYANEIFISSVLYRDSELIELSRLLLDEVNVDKNLIFSVEMYLNSISVKEFSSDQVYKRKYFIDKLIKHLIGIDICGVSYRNAIERLLKEIDSKDRTYCIYLAREFYPIWRHAYKLSDEFSLNKENTELDALIELWENIDTEIFSDNENWPLNVYINSMKQIGVPKKDIETRIKIAKLITIKLRRNHTNHGTNYRNAVQNIEPLFSNENLKEFYLIVSREYYRFIVGDLPQLPSV